jgi:hypothetical protein
LKNNFLNTFTLFLKQLKVPVTESSALEYLETHPDEGSIGLAGRVKISKTDMLLIWNFQMEMKTIKIRLII